MTKKKRRWIIIFSILLAIGCVVIWQYLDWKERAINHSDDPVIDQLLKEEGY